MELESVLVQKADKRQVLDLPEEVRLEVNKHQAEIQTCPCCGEQNEAEFPPTVTQATQYGKRVQARMVYLNVYHSIPTERTAEVMKDLYQQPVSVRTMAAISAKVGSK